jgi:hypothetical protein
MTGRRRFLAPILLATSLLGATTAHHHSILEDASSSRPAVTVLDPRCARTQPLSLHAIPRIIERDVCWACHWHRLLTGAPDPALPEPEGRRRTFAVAPPRIAERLTRYTLPSRGPPSAV